MKILKKVLAITGLLLVVAAVSGYIYFNKQYPNVGSAPDIKIEPTKERLERGKYLFTSVAACVDCHSQRDFSKASGPVVPGTEGMGGFKFTEELGFPGTFYAKNITPYALGSWTDGEILRAITEGVSKDGRALFPVMPYLSFGKMDKEDIYSIIAYLRTIPAIKNDVPESKADFPVSLLMKTMPTKNSMQPKPDVNNKVEYGKYLVSAADCFACHTVEHKGEFDMKKAFAGGHEFNLPGGVTVRSSNITPDNESGIGAWSKEQFIARFKSCNSPEYRNTNLKQGEFQTVMPWTVFAQIKDDDLGAIYEYLRTLPAIKNNVEKFSVNPIK